MKILFLITKGEIGGAQKSVSLLAKGLKEEGFNIYAGSGSKGALTEELEKSGIQTIIFKNLKRSLNPFSVFIFALELRKFLKKEKFDLISFNSNNTLFGILGLIGMNNRPKTVFTVHGWSFLSPGFKKSKILKLLFLFAMKILLPLVDGIIFVSEYDRKLAERYGLDKKGRVIHNGIEEISFIGREEAIKKLGVHDNKIILGAITRLEYAKNNELFIKAFNKLPKDIKDKAICIIIGSGPEKENYSLLITHYSLQDKVFLLGDIPDAKRYLKTFDVFVIPSRYEGLPHSLLEAMSAELPIIATKVGGIPDVLGEAGILIEPDNQNGLTEVLANLINNPSLREQLSKKSKTQIQKFSFSKTLQQTKTFFMEISSIA